MTSQENNLGGNELHGQTACESVQEMLGAYLDLELSEVEFASVDSHLNACSACQSELKSLEALVERLKALPEPALGRDLADSIAERLEKVAPQVIAGSADIAAEVSDAPPVVSMREFVENKRRFNGFRYVAAASALAVLAAGVYFFGGDRSQNIPTLVAQAPTISSGEAVKRVVPTKAVERNNSVKSMPSKSVGSIQKDSVNDHLAKDNQVKPSSKGVGPGQSRKVDALATVASADNDDVVDAYDDIVGGGVDDYGIGTNEDGLYAIQL
ncbi:MAG: zf-HC2 domain-containing protein [Candidatus Obscuribacterales bacterium]|nr:zf-HC2 domain-containing protein [Candidatus Obscuribacterales bacterium]